MHIVMPPKLNKIVTPKKTPPKRDTQQVVGSLKKSPIQPSSSTDVDPFAPKRNVLGAISPPHQEEVDQQEEVPSVVSEKSASRRIHEQVVEEDHLQLEKDRQHLEENALLEAELVHAEEVKREKERELEREQQPLKEITSSQDQPSSGALQIETDITSEEEKDDDLLGSSADYDITMNQLTKISQDEDEFQEATLLATQEAKINQILDKRTPNHMHAYLKTVTALSLDVPLLRAVFKGDIDTVKLYLQEDFSGPEEHFLRVSDSHGRTALHVAAAGSNPVMVEYLLAHNRLCLEKMKQDEMQVIKEERKSCLLELKRSMKKRLASSAPGHLDSRGSHSYSHRYSLRPLPAGALDFIHLSMHLTNDPSVTVSDLSDSFNKHDYRVAAIEKWFEGEVARVHRKVELLTETQWLSGLLHRDRNGLSPLHYAAHTGSLEVLRALLCVSPFLYGRGVFFKEASIRGGKSSGAGAGVSKGTVRRNVRGRALGDKPYEWFKPGGVYNSTTGEEVAVAHKLRTGNATAGPHTLSDKGADSHQRHRQKLTLHDVAQVSAFNAYISPTSHDHDEDGGNSSNRTEVDYDIVVPWLVRNMHRRCHAMGKKLGASAVDVLEEMAEMVNLDKGRVLILPEIRELLRYLGIVVTADVIKELCNIYPAALDLVEEKYENYNDNEEDMLLSDSKPFSSHFPNSGVEKNSEKQSSLGVDSKSDSDAKSSDNSEHTNAGGGSKCSGSKSCKGSLEEKGSLPARKKSLFDPSCEEVSYGLALDLLLDDMANGRGMKSIFNNDTITLKSGGGTGIGTGTGAGTGSSNGVWGDLESAEFCMPAVVSVDDIFHYRKLLVNCRDGAGNTALLVASALGKLHHVEELVSGGADISLGSLDRQTPLSVAKNASIIGILQREFVTQLKSKRTDMLSGGSSGGNSTGSRSRGPNASGNSSSLHVSQDFLNTLSSIPVTDGHGLRDSKASTIADEDIMLQLTELKTKRWAYSQSALTWAVETGMASTIDTMLARGIDANEADISGRSPLHTCMLLAGQATDPQAVVSLRKMAEAILNNGGDINATSISGKTPLHELFARSKSSSYFSSSSSVGGAGIYGQEISLLSRMKALLVRAFLQWGADPLKTDRQGYTSLYYCAKENMSVCMIEMLKTKSLDVCFQDTRGRTVLHTACIFGAEEVAGIIVNYDADYVKGIQCVEDKDGKTAKHLMSPHMHGQCLISLWMACRLGNSARVNAIIAKQREKDASAVYENVEEEQTARNPLDVTSGQEDGSSARDLWLLGGVDCKTRIHKWTPLHACIIGWAEFNAVRTKSRSTIKALKHGEKSSRGPTSVNRQPSFRNKKGSNPATLTAASFSTIVSVLIQNFAFVDSLEFKCRTPLMLAAAFDLPSAIDLLCTAGADVGMRDLDGNTALHYAYSCGSTRAATALEDRGADSTLENNDRRSPLEVMGFIGAIAPFFK